MACKLAFVQIKNTQPRQRLKTRQRLIKIGGHFKIHLCVFCY